MNLDPNVDKMLTEFLETDPRSETRRASLKEAVHIYFLEIPSVGNYVVPKDGAVKVGQVTGNAGVVGFLYRFVRWSDGTEDRCLTDNLRKISAPEALALLEGKNGP